MSLLRSQLFPTIKPNAFSRRNSRLSLKELGRIQAFVVAANGLTPSAISPWAECSPFALKIEHSFKSLAKPRKVSVLYARAGLEPQILLSLRCHIPVISNMWMNQIISRAEGVGHIARLCCLRNPASCSPPPGDCCCCHRAVREEASLEVPCREETVPFQC